MKFVIASLFFILGLQSTLGKTISSFVTTSELFEISQQKQSKYTLIDLRTPGELTETGLIKGAQHFDFLNGDFDNYLKNLDRSKKYIIYCRSGGRSGRAFKKMNAVGFNVRNYSPGMNGWLEKSKPTVKK